MALSQWVNPVAYCENDRYAQAVLLSRMQSGDLPTAPALGHSIASHSVKIEAVEHDCATWKIQKDGSTVFSWDKESSGDE